MRHEFIVWSWSPLSNVAAPFRDKLVAAFGAKPTLGFAPVSLEFDLLGEAKRIVYFHPEIANGGLDLCVPEQQLDRP